MNYRDIYELTLVTAILQRSTEAERRAVNPELPFRFSGLCNNTKRLKASLGYMSPVEYRQSLGLA